MRSVQTTYFELKGGLNLTTPPIKIPEGMCRDALNFDASIDGGYRYAAGYERYDGRPQPSEQSYYTIDTTEYDTSLPTGSLINGATSGATGLVVGHGTNYVSVAKIIGTFQQGELLQLSGLSFAVAQSTPYVGGARTNADNAIFKANTADLYRVDIQAVEGSGAILGVWRYNGDVYAFRNDVTGTKAVMWKATASGWSEVSLGYEVAFANIDNTVAEGQTILQSGGAVTAIINRIVIETGSQQSGTNTGKFLINAPQGGILAVGAATTDNVNTFQLTTVSSEITMLPNGKFSFQNYNFGGALNTLKMYGCDGVNRAFEFDGTYYTPITTGMIDDSPSFIATHANRLFLAFGASLQYSVAGEPYSFNVVVGAGELAMGDNITGMISLIGSDSSRALALFTTNKTSILYGSSSLDFQLVDFSLEAGGIAYSAQTVGQVYVMDELGLRQLGATQGFGNFISSQVTKYVLPFLNERQESIVGSAISRLKNQYRLYYADRYVLHVTVDNEKIVGIMPMRYAHAFNCVMSQEEGGGEEYLLAGGNDGYVYRLDKGTSFDGQSIDGYLVLAYNHLKSPRLRKRFRKAAFEVTGSDYATFKVGFELGYGSSDISQGIDTAQDLDSAFGGVYWDSFTWDQFYWDGKSLLPAETPLGGNAENISLAIRASSAVMQEFTLNSAIIHYSQGRQLR